MRSAGLAHALDAIASTHVDQTPWRYADERWQREAERGIAAHECSHAVTAVAVGGTVRYVEFSLDSMSGLCPYWHRDDGEPTIASIVSEIAVLLAGAEGYRLATGDLAGAIFYASTDYDDIERTLAETGLPRVTTDQLRATAEEVVKAVMAHLWPAVAKLTDLLLLDGRLAGGEVHALVEGRYARELKIASQVVWPRTAQIEQLRAAVRGGALSVLRGGPS